MAEELSLTELAILAMTNDPPENSRPDSRAPVLLTNKESYFWAVALAVVLEREEISVQHPVHPSRLRQIVLTKTVWSNCIARY
jgi:hypothetical protein